MLTVFIKEKEISHLNLNDFFHAKCHAILISSTHSTTSIFRGAFFWQRVSSLLEFFPSTNIFFLSFCTRWRSFSSFFSLTIMKTSIITFVIFILTFMNSWHLKGPKTSRLVIIMCVPKLSPWMHSKYALCIENTYFSLIFAKHANTSGPPKKPCSESLVHFWKHTFKVRVYECKSKSVLCKRR